MYTNNILVAEVAAFISWHQRYPVISSVGRRPWSGMMFRSLFMVHAYMHHFFLSPLLSPTHPSVQRITVTVIVCLPYTVVLLSYSVFIWKHTIEAYIISLQRWSLYLMLTLDPLRQTLLLDWCNVAIVINLSPFGHSFCSHPPQCPQSVALQLCCGQTQLLLWRKYSTVQSCAEKMKIGGH